MPVPVTTRKGPYLLEAQEGKRYAWCNCGESNRQPLCDGNHTGTVFTPVIFHAEKTGTLVLCGCKRTKKPPYCDGTHSSL